MFKSIANISAPKKWMYTPKEGEQFFFMHIPKTGGTTFRKMLTNHFPEGSYYPTQEDLLANGGGYLSKGELIRNQKNILDKPLIIGHYNIDLISHLSSNVKIIAFYRNPIDRILSHINHILNHDKDWIGADPNDVVKSKIRSIANLQTRMVHNSDSRSMKNMLLNMSRIDFIGIQEYFTESVKMLNQFFNWNLEVVEMENVSGNSIYDSISSKSMSLICRNLKQEILIYDYACERFEKRQKELDK